MSNAKSELFTFLGAAFATLLGLLVLQKAYASYIDVSYHQRLQQAGPSEALLEARKADEAQLQKGKLPLSQAMSRLGSSRTTAASIAPQPSQDLSAVSGWIHHPGFKPAVAFPIYVARAPVAAAPKATEPPAAAPSAADEPPAAASADKSGAKNAAKPAKPKAQ
jgi:hypothetical protein